MWAIKYLGIGHRKEERKKARLLGSSPRVFDGENGDFGDMSRGNSTRPMPCARVYGDKFRYNLI